MKRETSFNPMGDRYAFDFKKCTGSQGWAQLDSNQDAPYYGNWVNPTAMETVSYCEGDISHIKCESEEEFKSHLASTLQWHIDRGDKPKIDCLSYPTIAAEFERLGFKDFLH